MKEVYLPLLQVEKQVEYDGIEMGVLENGVPYLSERGLARMCGINRAVLNRLAVNWAEERVKGRGSVIRNILIDSGYDEDTLFIKSINSGQEVNAYTEPVCLALLEYYAFEADNPRQEAAKAYRTLARHTFRQFVYAGTGYSPHQQAIDSWKHYHDRVDMLATAVPRGFFGVFHEIAVMIVPMIHSGVLVSDKTVPDISVGKVWSKYWKDNELSQKYGERVHYDHEYPSYYPQSKSNPQPAYAYPERALGVFREWLRENYIYKHFPKYLLGQAQKGALTSTEVKKAIDAFQLKAIK